MLDIFQERRWKQSHPGFYTRAQKLTRWSQISTFILLGLVGLIFLGIFLFAWFSKDLPRPDRVSRTEGMSTVISDRNGEVLYDIYGEQNRVPVALSDMPLHLRQATIAIEDKDFYKHQGFSLTGMGRAMINIFVFRNLQGGSTLTQQLVKNVLLTSERTIPRKIKEFILAVQIERKYSKDQILQMYLNEAPYGGTAVGVETASQTYFGKHTKDLSLTEAVVLAGLPQSPSKYSPIYSSNPKAYILRSEQVLRRMREDGYISQDQEEKVKKELPQVKFSEENVNFRAPHFVMYVKEQLIQQFGEKMVEQGGLKVTTTLDWKIQQEAEKIVKEEIDKLKSLKVSNGAAVVIDPKTGEILSMVGSKDYSATDTAGLKFNVVTQGLRQPGSAIKPIIYATAFKKGYTPSTLIVDVETHFPGGDKPDYVPKNYDGKFRGPVQVRYALANSINIVAVKMLAMVGVKDALSTAYDMGLNTLKPTDENLKRLGLSMTLGGGEVTLLDLTSAFSVFASEGVRHEPLSILKVQDSSGKTLFEAKPGLGQKVLSPEVSFLISNILQDNEARKEIFGPSSWLVVSGKTVSVKTGTTDDKRDNWTVGYTPSSTVGVWVGNNDNSPMNPTLASGVTGAAPIWNRLMRLVLKNKADEPMVVPSGIVNSQIDGYGGGLPKDGQPQRTEYFISGTEPTATANIYQRLKISKNNGKLANAVEIAKGEFEEKDFIVLTEQDPVSTDGKNRWQEGIDAWLSGNSDSKYHPPRDVSTDKLNDVAVRIKTPGDHNQINDNNVQVEADAVSAGEIIKMEISVDGEIKKTVSSNNFSDKINMTTGPHEIKVKAYDSRGNAGETAVKIGVNVSWDASPSPTPTATP